MFFSLIFTLIVIFLTYLKWKSNYWQRKNIKTLSSHLIFGNIENPFTTTKSFSTQYEELYNKTKKAGLKYLGSYNLFQTAIFIPIHLDIVKLIMSTDFPYFVDRGFYYNEKYEPITAHLFALGGQKWRNLRVKMTPTFTPCKMKQMFHTVAECGVLLEKILSEKIENSDGIDVKETFGRFTTDVICSCAFGLDVHASTDPDSEFSKHGRKAFQMDAFRRLKQIVLMYFPNVSNTFRLRYFSKDVSNFFSKIVRDTIAFRLKNNYVRNDFLQLMIDMQKIDNSITLDTITAQCFLFFFVGFETSSLTISFALYELALKQHIQDKVRFEINTVLSKYNGEINYDSILELKYMRQVIDETLRIWPPLPVITRTCCKEYTFQDENITIEKGTRILIPISGIQHDEEYFENPMDFNPDRFSDENRNNIPHHAYMPFGEGPRTCLGMRFGLMQTKVGLTSVLRNYRVTLNKKTQLPIKIKINEFFPYIEGGLWLNFEKL